MVIYFSGTGNSRYIAKAIAEALGDELVCLNDKLKRGDTESLCVNGRLVIVTPTHAWRIPRSVGAWLRSTELVGAEKAWFVMSCGSEIGNAAKYNRALCADKGLRYMGSMQIIMPENYIAMFDAPNNDEARKIVAKAQPDIARAGELIAQDSEFPLPRCNVYDRIISGPVNPAFYTFCVSARSFVVSDKCISCEKCASLCPTNCLSIKDGKPVWGKGCIHCMSCICYCPAEAIEYGKISLGKPRYHFEAL